MAFDGEHHDIVMFGGVGASGAALADTWVWDGSAWSKAEPRLAPPPLEGAVMAYDPVSRQVLLFGGSLVSSTQCAGTGVIVPPGVRVSPLTEPRPTVTSTPCHPVGTGAEPPGVPTPAGAPPSDTWAWDGSTWHKAAASGPAFSPGQTWMAADPVSGRVLLVVSRWTPVPAVACPIPAGEQAIACPAIGRPSSFTLEWSWDGSQWRQVGPRPDETGVGLAPEGTTALVTDPVSGRLALYRPPVPVAIECPVWGHGGAAAPAPAAGTTAPPAAGRVEPVPCPETSLETSVATLTDWTGSGWGKALQLGGAPRGFPGRAFSTRSGLVVAVGPTTPNDSGANTWVWSGSWSATHAKSHPAALLSGSAAYDPETRQLVLFGGAGFPRTVTPTTAGPAVLDGTWTWDGSDWTLRGGTAPPPPSPWPAPIPLPAPTQVAPTGYPLPAPSHSCPTLFAHPGAVEPMCPLPAGVGAPSAR